MSTLKQYDSATGKFVPVAYSGRDAESILNSLVAHKAETVSHVASFTRDVSITGLQVIEVPFKVKSIIAIGTVTGTKIFSEGFWGENNSARALYTAPDENYYSDTSIIALSPSSGNFAIAYVQAIEDYTITLNWQKSGSPIGTATIHLLFQTH
jgi:hypothetical protein